MEQETKLDFKEWSKKYPEAKLINYESNIFGIVSIYSFRLGYFVVVDDQYVVTAKEKFKDIEVEAKAIWQKKKERYNENIR